MSAVWIRASTALRRAQLPALVLVLLIGVVGGCVLAAAAGARRTANAYDRMLVASRAADMMVNPDLGTETELDFDAVRSLPEVEDAGVVAGILVIAAGPDGVPDFDSIDWLSLAPADDRAVTIDRPNLIAGRRPDQSEPYEVLINPILAAERDLAPGDRIDLMTAPIDELFAAEAAGELPELTPFEATVTGIGVSSGEIVDDEQWASGSISFTRAFYERHADSAYFFGLLARLRGSAAERASFRAEVERLADGEPIAFQTQATTTAITTRAIRPAAVALGVFAVVAGLAGLVVVAHALSRQLAGDRADAPALTALGMTHRRRWDSAMLRMVVISAAGAAAAMVVAVSLSPLTPVGIARLAEPSPGVAVDVSVLILGFVVIALVLPVCVAWPAWRAVDAHNPHGVRPARSHAADALARLGSPASTVVGVRLALESGRGRTAVPAGSTLIATSLAVAATAAALTFAAGLNRLVDTPRLYGWDWDVLVSNADEEASEGDWTAAADAVAANDDVDAVARGNNGEVTLDGQPIPAIGIEMVRGVVGPTIAEGRAPEADDEVALGARTLEGLDVSIGDRVEATTPAGATVELTVVGQAVFPGFGTYSGSDNTELGTGAYVTLAALSDLGPDFAKDFLVVDLREGAQPAAADLLGNGSDPVDVELFTFDTAPLRPADVVQLGRVAATPIVLSALLAGFALAALTHTLVTSIGVRRRDLAVLRVLGFGRRQVGATVAWQATTVAAVALVVGLPIGIALGRWTWSVAASGLAIPPESVTPALLLGMGALVTLLAANVVAAFPAWSASRTPAAAILRTE